jgi:hypothetical protein
VWGNSTASEGSCMKFFKMHVDVAVPELPAMAGGWLLLGRLSLKVLCVWSVHCALMLCHFSPSAHLRLPMLMIKQSV